MSQNIIAMIYDFDLTLSPEYMQKPLFEGNKFKITEQEFWKLKEELVKKHEEKGKNAEKDTAYLHLLIELSKQGKPLEGLTEKVLQEAGKKIKYYPGIPEFFNNIKDEIEKNPKYIMYGIKIEHYIVSAGLKEILRGSILANYVEQIDGCEFFYNEQGIPTGVARAVTNTQKTETIFKINKGVFKNKDIDVNTFIPDNLRRIPFQNMIYFGDGPSDVPCMSLIKSKGGFTFAVYNPNSEKENPAEKAYSLVRAGRANFCVQANYNKGSELYDLTKNVLIEISDKIITAHKTNLEQESIKPPEH
ncbi:haloacid dehalogenase-like hydrolase [Candidatus Woesearchaeota archaeon ex4484_78]|nr:MAG: haloacid dehalogenase-like hydrolase [Candidatus Woesearchaeota archaeon ex4484_78]